MKKDFPAGLRRKDDMNIEYHAIKGLRLRMYWCWWILSATITVTSWAMPAKSKSAWSVFSFWVLRLATQKLSLKWLMDFSTFTRILYVSSHYNTPMEQNLWRRWIRISCWKHWTTSRYLRTEHCWWYFWTERRLNVKMRRSKKRCRLGVEILIGLFSCRKSEL